MKKRWMGLLAALILFLPMWTYAEEAPAEHGLVRLVEQGGEEPVWKGIAIPLADGILMTAAADLPETGLAFSDGVRTFPVTRILPAEKTGLSLLFYDSREEKPRFSPWKLTDPGTSLSVDALTVESSDAAGGRFLRKVLNAGEIRWSGMACMLTDLSGSAVPGAPVLTADGELAGVIAAEYAEGNHRYIALTAQEIRDVVSRTEIVAGVFPGAPEGFTVTLDANLVTFDWSAVQMDPPAEGKTRYMVFSDTLNSYLEYVPADLNSLTVLLTPGRTYLSGLVDTEGPPAKLPEAFDVTALPEPASMTDHGFRAQVTSLALKREDGENTVYSPLREVTADQLRSEDVCFYSVSSYDVDEKQEETLLITLNCPSGTEYRYPSGWIWDPAFEDRDEWGVSLQDGGFLSGLERENYAPGMYQMVYYIGGKLADLFFFELK